MPAHSSGAAPAGSSPSGFVKTKCSSTTICVGVAAAGRRVPRPHAAVGHGEADLAVVLVSAPALALPHELTKQPTPTRCPLERVTSLPALTTRPMISWPGTRDTGTPLVARGVDVGVADAAEVDGDWTSGRQWRGAEGVGSQRFRPPARHILACAWFSPKNSVQSKKPERSIEMERRAHL